VKPNISLSTLVVEHLDWFHVRVKLVPIDESSRRESLLSQQLDRLPKLWASRRSHS
jgi:hypothetical protein